MARKAKRKLPKHIRQALDARQEQERAVDPIPPMRTPLEILERPPDLQQPAPKALPPASGAPAHALPGATAPDWDGASESTANPTDTLAPLPPPPDANQTEALLHKIGASVLVGHQPDADEDDPACTFWIDLKEEILGGIQIRISLRPGRRIVASMLVTTQATESLIRERIPRLRQRLQRRGLHLDEIEVITP